MSIFLNNGSEPEGIKVKSGMGKRGVLIGDYRISMPDFVEMTKYVLTNTDLEDGENEDPRLQFVAWVKSLDKILGYNPGKMRLAQLPAR